MHEKLQKLTDKLQILAEKIQKLTLKQWMLIIMSTLLALTVILAGIVIGEVLDMLAAFTDGPATQPSTGESVTQGQPETTTPEPTNDTQESTEASTAPTVTESTESTEPTETHVHEFVKDKTTAATCTSMGYTVYKCSCGKTDVRDFREQLGHQYQETTVEQTCEQEGCTMKSCIRCGDVQKTDVKPALGHDYQTVKTVVADCEQEGYEEKECSRCHSVKRENIQSALGHAYGPWETVKNATDTTPGERKHTCSNCNKTLTEVIPATGEFKINSTAMSSEDENWTYYRIQVGTKASPYAYTYSIYVGLDNRKIDYDYTKDGGLVVTYTTSDGQKQQTLDPYADGVLTIDQDGKVSHKAPTVSPEPTEPSTTPTESTQPSESTDPSESTATTDPSESVVPTDSSAPTTAAETEPDADSTAPGEPNT